MSHFSAGQGACKKCWYFPIFHGKTVTCSVSDPVTGQIKTEQVRGGEQVTCVVYPQAQAGDKCDILRNRVTTNQIPGYVLRELVQDVALCDRILDDTGLDILRDLAAEAGGDPSGRAPGGRTATPEVLGQAARKQDRDEAGLREKLDKTEAAQAAQQGSISPDKALPGPAPSGGGSAAKDGGDGVTIDTTTVFTKNTTVYAHWNPTP